MKAQLPKFGISDSSPKVSVRAAGLPLLMAVVRRAAGTLWVLKGLAGAVLMIGTSPGRDAIPWDQLGTKAAAQYSGDGISVVPAADGARLRAAFQKLEAQATTDGLWLESTAAESRERFRIKSVAVGRVGQEMPLVPDGHVSAEGETVTYQRPRLTEQYGATMDGVRQDFVVTGCPSGAGELAVLLELRGAKAEAVSYGVKLTLADSAREVAYSRLHVTDATGRELAARMEVVATDRLRIAVEDEGAIYPVRIDPTFSDADWVSTGALGGANNAVNAIATDEAGNLYVGGVFTVIGSVAVNGVAKWDGNEWTAMGSGLGGSVLSLVTSGTDVYAAGSFVTAGGNPANRVAKWDGLAWSSLGAGVDNTVFAMTWLDGNLCVGGLFTTAGGNAANRVALWNGTAWSALGTGLNSYVTALAVQGGALYVGGEFTTAGGVGANRVAKWESSSWSPLGAGINGSVWSLAPVAGGLYAGGSFTTADGSAANSVAHWNGTAWSPLGTGISGGSGTVYSLVVQSGTLYAGGHFNTAGSVDASGIAKWTGTEWQAVGGGLSGGFGVRSLALVGSDLVAGGSFLNSNSLTLQRLAKWNGTAWSAVSPGTDGNVNAALVLNGDLYVAGTFNTVAGVPANRIAKWNGSSWSALGTGLNGWANSLAASPTGDLYVGGSFGSAGGVPGTSGIARWNGSVWSRVGTGTSGTVYALAVTADRVYAAGSFNSIDGVAVGSIAQWNGTAWSPLGSGLNGLVYALTVVDGKLIAGGSFTTAGGNAASRVASWDGTSWTALGAGVGGTVFALTGRGSSVYAGGFFSTAGGLPANNVAQWNGTQWFALGAGVNELVLALTSSPNYLYVGGRFTTAGGNPANRIARWSGSIWSPLGSGANENVRALALQDGVLHAGGDFTMAGGKVSAFLAEALVEVPEPEIVVEQPAGNPLTDGSSSVDFGSLISGTSGVPKSFSIFNAGTAPLDITGVTRSGTHAAEFAVNTSAMATTVAPGQSTTFTVTFTPAGTGPRTAAIQIASNDADEHPFDLALTGAGIAPPVAFTSAPQLWAVKDGIYRFAPTASNTGTGPVTFTVLEKPAWLSFNGTLLSGTPPNADEGLNPLVILRATNGDGFHTDLSFRVMIGRLVGPVASPPGGGLKQWVTGMPKLARSGGDSLLITGATRADEFPIFWGLLPGGVGMKMNYVGPSGSSGTDFDPPGGFTFAPAEIGQWNPGASTPGGGIGIWQGQTNRPASIGGAAVATFLRAEVRDIGNTVALPLTSGDEFGLAPSVGALARVADSGDLRIGLRLHANAAFPSGTPALDWFNSLAGKLPTDRTVTALSSGFYWVNTPPRLSLNTGVAVAQDATVVLTTTHLNAADTEDDAADIRFELGNGNNGGPPLKGMLQLDGPGGWTALGAGGIFTKADLLGGKVRYVHGGSYDVSDGFQFRVLDAQNTAARDGDFSLFSFPLSITPRNHPPVALDQSVTSGLGATVNGQLDFSDPDSGFIPQTFVFSLLEPSTLGTLTLLDPATGSFSFQAGAVPGSEMISWQVSDGEFQATGTLTLTVANQTPVVQPLSLTGTTAGTISGTLVVEDPDLPAQALTLAVVAAPAKGTVEIDGLGIEYTPAPGRFGSDTFTLTATDALGQISAVQTVTVLVRPTTLGAEAVFVSARLGGGAGPGEGVIQRVNPANGDVFTLARNLGQEARGIVWSEALQKLLVLVEVDNSGSTIYGLVKVDALTGEWTMADIVTTNGSLVFPIGLAKDGEDHVLVANGPGGVVRINLATGAQEALALGLPPGAFVASALPSPDGGPLIWVTSIGDLGTAGDGTLFACDRVTATATTPVTFTPTGDPAGLMAAGPSSFVVARSGVPVEMIALDPLAYTPHPGSPAAPWGLPVSVARSSGSWLVTDPFAGKLYSQLLGTTTISEVIAAELGLAFGLVVVESPAIVVSLSGGPSVVAGSTLDMGSTTVFGGVLEQVFTLSNSGGGTLNLTGDPRVEISGDHAADFTVTSQPAADVAPGGSTSFSISFDPSAEGVRSATVNILHDGAESTPFTFTLQGTAFAPEIALFDGSESPANALTNGQATAVDFGSYPLPMTGVSRTFTVKNTGSGPLTLFSVSATPMSAFQVQGIPFSPIPPGESRTILVHFSSNTVEAYSGSFSILSNATTGSLFSVPIRGAVIDLSPPFLTQVSLSGFGSNPSYPGYLKSGAMISLNILSNEPIQPPVVEICGKLAQVGESFGGTSWFAHVTVDETFPQGQASISVTATDLAGNTAPPVTFPTSGMMVTVDTLPPAILSSWMSSSNPAWGWAKAGDTVYAGFTMSEEIVNPSFTVFGAPWMGTVMNTLGSVSIISNPIMAEPEGPVVVAFQCMDRAGNSAEFNPVSFTSPVVVDRTPPLITQGDLTAELTGPSGTAVAFSPTATDALGAIVSVTSSPPTGSFFSPGITSISVNATDSAGNTGSGNFNLTMLEAADFWRDSFFDQTANSGDAADDADPDNDGVVNLIERAFNLHPLQPGRPVLTAGGGTGGLPLVTVLGEGENRRLRVEYLRRKADSLPGLTYTPQFSTMLDEAWTPAAGEWVSSINDLWERVTVDDAPGAVRSFGRVKITSP